MKAASVILICISILLILLQREKNGGEAKKTGAVIVLTKKGLDYWDNIGLRILKKELLSNHLPSIRKNMRKHGFKIYSTKVTHFSLPRSTITTTNRGLNLKLKGGSISVASTLYAWKKLLFFKLDKTLNFQVTVRYINADITVGASRTNDGKPEIAIAKCSTKFSRVDFYFKGGGALTSLINFFFRPAIENIIKLYLEEKLCGLIDDRVDEANDIFNDFPVEQTIKHLKVDNSLTKDPIFTDNAMRIYVSGLLRRSNDNEPPPYIPKEILVSSGLSNMANVYISEYLPNSWLYSEWKESGMVDTLEGDRIPPEVRRTIEEACGGTLLQCINTVLTDLGIQTAQTDSLNSPNCSTILKFDLSKKSGCPVPKVRIRNNSTTGTAQGFITLEAKCSHLKKSVVITKIKLTTEFKVQHLRVNTEDKIIGEIVIPDFDFEMLEPRLAWHKEIIMETMITSILTEEVVPNINRQLSAGIIPLPKLPMMILRNAKIRLRDHNVLVATDFYYRAPPK